MRPPAPLGLALTLLLAACASTPEATLPPLTRLARHAAESRAELAREGLTPPADGFASEPRELPVEGAIQVRAQIAALEPDAARRLVGWELEDGPAWSTSLAEVERLLAACRGEERVELRDPAEVFLAPGEPFTVWSLDQLAYVESFEFEVEGGVLLVDPVVGVFIEGMALSTCARAGAEPGRTALELELELAHLCRPVPVYQTRPLGAIAPLSVQQPLAAVQHLRTQAELAPEECLVLVRPALDGTDRFLFVFVAARPAQHGLAQRGPSAGAGATPGA